MIVEGELHLFTSVDGKAPWFDPQQQAEIQLGSVEPRVVTALERYRPDHQAADFIFAAKKHLLVFETQFIAARLAARLVEQLLAQVDPKLELSVTAIQQHEVLNQIFGLELKKLTITLNRPNPDEPDEIESAIVEEMKRNRAQQFRQEYSAAKGEALTPDKRVRKVAELGLANGKVEGVGKSREGVNLHLSTDQQPATVLINAGRPKLQLKEALNYFHSLMKRG